MRERQSFKQTVLGQLDILISTLKKKLDPYLILYTKINSKLIKQLNIKAKIIKLLEEKTANYHDIGSGNGFSDMTPKAQASKEKKKIDKLGVPVVAQW